jgi:hypothetical protein
VALASGVAHPSNDEGALAAGTYGFIATYAGNSNYKGSTGSCESVTVDKANTNASTSVVREDTGATVPQNGNVPVGTSVHDTATVTINPAGTPPFTIGGTVTYHFYNSADCSTGEFGSLNSKTWPQTVTMSGGTVPNSQSTGALPAGFYGFKAVYNGNSNYNGSTGSCESFTVFNAALTPGYWKNHLANSNKNGPYYSGDCATKVGANGGSCSNNGPWAIQFLPQSLGGYTIPAGDIVDVAKVFNLMNCGASTDQGAVGCLAGHLLATKLNLANKSIQSACITQAVSDADAFLTSVGYTGPAWSGTLTPAQRSLAISIQTKLNNYNNGSITC